MTEMVYTKADRQFGVHNTHCCTRHGCKYMDPRCPVEFGNAPGVFCEDCQNEGRDYDGSWNIESRVIAALMNRLRLTAIVLSDEELNAPLTRLQIDFAQNGAAYVKKSDGESYD